MIMIFNISYLEKGLLLKADESSQELPMKKGQARRQIKSEDLFKPGETEIWILRGTECYRLQVTRSGKLILTK